jgi:hypothetical protein
MQSDSEVRILTARVGYEFRLDDLRLTMLSTRPVINSIAAAFQFKASAIATPPASFGPVQATLPAGVVFQSGMWIDSESQIVPIRLLHIEPQRIVIDVAGPSSALDGVYARLLEAVSPITAPDGSPIIGKPTRILRFSELSFDLPASLDKLFSPALRTLIDQYSAIAGKDRAFVILPSLHWQLLPPGQEYTGEMTVADGRTFSLALRAGTTPEEGVYFSAAPLDTTTHIELVHQLMNSLSSDSQQEQKAKSQ